MVQTERGRTLALIAPVFLLALVGIFVIAPWSLKDKLDAICFGI